MSDISVEEDHHSAFILVYQTALNALASDAETACEAMGNYNTPWEIQDEVSNFAYLADSPVLALTAEQRNDMRHLAEGLKKLPSDAIAPKGATMTTRDGCLTAMCHPAWEPLRREAIELSKRLEEAFDRSEDYLGAL